MQLSGSQANVLFSKLLDKGLKIVCVFLRKDYCPAVLCALEIFPANEFNPSLGCHWTAVRLVSGYPLKPYNPSVRVF